MTYIENFSGVEKKSCGFKTNSRRVGMTYSMVGAHARRLSGTGSKPANRNWCCLSLRRSLKNIPLFRPKKNGAPKRRARKVKKPASQKRKKNQERTPRLSAA